MGLAKVQIQILPERHFTGNYNMVMGRELAQTLGLKPQPLWIKFGSAADTATIALSKSMGHKVHVSDRLAARLKLTPQPLIHAHFDTNYLRLKLAPLLGILINTQPLENQDEPFTLMNKFLEECAVAGQIRGAQVAVFSPEQIQMEQRSVQGMIYQKGAWRSVTLPFPDAIYNRITSRRVEQLEGIQKKLGLLRDRFHIPIFNEKFLNKYQVHQILSRDEQISTMLPETYLFDVKRVRELFQKYPILYLKPINGSLGGGIIRILREKDRWFSQSVTPNGISTQVNNTLRELCKYLVKRIGRQAYLVQQGLNLVRYEKQRQVDFRVLAQKNRYGEWQITSAVGRIANDQHIVSNLARGGTVRKAVEVLNELTDLPHKPTITELRNQALEIATTFETLAEGHYAELGIDLAIDTDGKMWLIEINSKPSKTDDTVTDSTMMVRPSVVKLLEYVEHLAGLHADSQRRKKS